MIGMLMGYCVWWIHKRYSYQSGGENPIAPGLLRGDPRALRTSFHCKGAPEEKLSFAHVVVGVRDRVAARNELQLTLD